MKTQHLIPILCLAAFCNVSAQTTNSTGEPKPNIVASRNLPGVVVVTVGTNISTFGAPQALIYKDAETNVMIYVESDARHVAAINPDGKVLWNRDPFADAKLMSNNIPEFDHPKITWIGLENGVPFPGNAKCIGITFSGGMYGYLEINKGDFTYLGVD
jgi:hypothetical protein